MLPRPIVLAIAAEHGLLVPQSSSQPVHLVSGLDLPNFGDFGGRCGLRIDVRHAQVNPRSVHSDVVCLMPRFFISPVIELHDIVRG